MKVVLLAAGRSFRIQPIADKNFLQFFGKPLVQHQIEALARAGFDDVLVVGGKHNLAALKALARELTSARLHVAVREQKELELGMAGAVLTAASWIGKDPFLLVSSNDVLEASAFAAVMKSSKKGESVLLAKKVSEYFPGGYLKLRPSGHILEIVEKPKPGREPSKLVNIVVHYHADPKAFMAALKSTASDRDDRYEAALNQLFQLGFKYHALPYLGFWQPVKYPWHVLSLMERFLKEGLRVEGRGARKAQVSATAVISGNVFLDEGVRVLDHAVIIGPAYIGKNSVIATNALVRESHIGANCVIGFGSEVARSYVGDHVWTHTNYIGDSVIGNDVSFGAGAVTGNLRLDEKAIPVSITKRWNGKEETEKIESGRTKLGLITGDHIRVGINTSFMPGVKVGSNSFVGAGITVAQDIPEGSYVTGDWTLKIRPNRATISPRNTP